MMKVKIKLIIKFEKSLPCVILSIKIKMSKKL